jgi:hypothetical protein
MSEIYKQRMSAHIEGDFVVFIIGMRINKFWKLRKWLPVFLAMPKMIAELYDHPETGFLGHVQSGLLLVQYWRSFEHLEAYARSHDHTHWPAWVAFNKRVRHSDGDVGIWHETYQVAAGAYETIYGAMPAIGLGKASTLVPATGHRQTAHERIHLRQKTKEVGSESLAPGESYLHALTSHS